jgi:nucleotide-binding universal stress UspA family protein/nitrite reductase/ring-hydroxylating ferredoxin subunit
VTENLQPHEAAAAPGGPGLTYRTIVVGTDGSPTARLAEARATRLAKAHDAMLLIASAYADDDTHARAVLQTSADTAREHWPRVDVRAVPGDPATAMVTLARDEQADLLVVGNKGMAGRMAFLLGSIPDRISHAAPCDLLIVKTASDDAARRANADYRSMLVATDGSQTSLQAVRRAHALGERTGASPVMFYAGHPKTADIVFAEVTRSYLPAGTLGKASGRGDPADAICRMAEDEGYDLIVVGNRGMLGRRFHIGTIPNKVSHQSPTDLLIVKTTSDSIDDLSNGEGAVVRVNGQDVAAYRDDHGAVHQVSARCAHMGCIVGWNPDERTWDCPCHGSRYDAFGEVIRGPATRGLASVEEAGS